MFSVVPKMTPIWVKRDLESEGGSSHLEVLHSEGVLEGDI